MNKEEQKANILKDVKDLIEEIDIEERDKKFALAVFNNDLNELLDFYISKEEIIKQCENILPYLELENEIPSMISDLTYKIPVTPAQRLRIEANNIEKKDKDIKEFIDFINKLKELDL